HPRQGWERSEFQVAVTAAVCVPRDSRWVVRVRAPVDLRPCAAQNAYEGRWHAYRPSGKTALRPSSGAARMPRHVAKCCREAARTLTPAPWLFRPPGETIDRTVDSGRETADATPPPKRGHVRGSRAFGTACLLRCRLVL